VACWGTKAAISLKRVNINEKLLWEAYRNAPKLFLTVPSPTPYGLLFPKIGGLQPPPKASNAIISGTGKTTDFKFGLYIHRVHPNKIPLKIWAKKERGRIQGPPNVLKYPLLSHERVRLRTSKILYAHS